MPRFGLSLIATILFVSPVAAQVFDLGPSDPDLFDNVINIPPDPDIPSFFGSDFSVGGDGLNTQLNLFDGGSVGENFDTLEGSEFNISDGTVGHFLLTGSGSEVNISGGSLGRIDTLAGSLVNVSGGTVSSLTAGPGSEINVSGGTFVFGLTARPGSDLEMVGGEFQLNGEPITTPTVSFDPHYDSRDVFTGTYADGTPFILTTPFGEFQLTSVELPPLDLSPLLVSAPNLDLLGLRPGQTLTLQEGGVLRTDFRAVDGTLIIEGGSLGNDTRSANVIVDINGGSVGDGFQALSGSEINISGGSVGDNLRSFFGSEVNISGGSVGNNFEPQFDSLVNVNGGSIGDNFQGDHSSVINVTAGTIGERFGSYSGDVNISGGTIGDRLFAFDGANLNITGGTFGNSTLFVQGRGNISGGTFGSGFYLAVSSRVNISGGTFAGNFDVPGERVELNLFGHQFMLDGVLLDDSLTIAQAFTILDRDVTLSAVLADGSPFSIDLNSVDTSDDQDFVAFDSTTDDWARITVTLVASPLQYLLGDCNQDGEVNFLDIAPFIQTLSSGNFLVEADCNLDGEVTFLDIRPFIIALTGY